jgi:hypothetical protein
MPPPLRIGDSHEHLQNEPETGQCQDGPNASFHNITFESSPLPNAVR